MPPHEGPEVGGPLLEEGGDGLGHVVAERREDLGAVLEVDAGLQAADLELAPHHLLGHPHADRAVGGDLLGDVERGVDDLAVGHDPADEADALGLVGVDEPAGEQQLEGGRRADEAGQQPAHADVAARQADADEGDVEAGRRRRHADVGGEGQGEPAAGGRRRSPRRSPAGAATAAGARARRCAAGWPCRPAARPTPALGRRGRCDAP